MSFFDRLLGTEKQDPPEPYPEEVFELRVSLGGEGSTFSIPIDPAAERALRPARRPGPRQSADECWVSASEQIEVAGRQITTGHFYLGTNLLTAEREFPVVEPALVDPSLPVASSTDSGNPDRLYWPSYESLAPEHRAAYLDWLASDRRLGSVSPSLVFLYIYGLERRLLADPAESSAATAERGVVREEVVRLRGAADEEKGHAPIARRLDVLLGFLEAQDLLRDSASPQPPRERSGWQVPLVLRLMLGETAAGGLPLPAELALSWALTSPEAYLRTPAQRCRPEFSALFERRYCERYGDGLPPPKGKPLEVEYRPSSHGLREVREQTSLPDVADSPKLVNPLRELARDCCAELDAYSRLLGRSPDSAGSLEAVALLPAPLLKDHDNEELGQLRDLLEKTSAAQRPWLLDADDLLAHWPGGRTKLRKNEAVSLAQLVEKLGFGIEPDVRFGGRAPAAGDTVVIFPAQETDSRTPSPAYAAAATLLELASVVAAADGTVTAEEERHLEAHLESAAGLRPDERERLRAHVEQVTRSKPSFAGLRKKLESLSLAQREAIGRSLVTVAAADGHVSPEEIKTLGKVYDLLGLDPESVYSEAHAATTEAGETEPVAVPPGQSEPADSPARSDERRGEGLDRSAIEERIEETALVSSLLAGIFDEGDQDGGAGAATVAAADPGGHGLDEAQLALARALADQPSWTRVEVETMAAKHDLLVDGALEEINNAAFEACDAPFAEGDDPIEIDPDVAREMLS
jgi:uncharacterized tellurite resistance protein B-like protein